MRQFSKCFFHSQQYAFAETEIWCLLRQGLHRLCFTDAEMKRFMDVRLAGLMGRWTPWTADFITDRKGHVMVYSWLNHPQLQPFCWFRPAPRQRILTVMFGQHVYVDKLNADCLIHPISGSINPLHSHDCNRSKRIRRIICLIARTLNLTGVWITNRLLLRYVKTILYIFHSTHEVH